MKNDIEETADSEWRIKGTDGRKRDRTIGKTLQKAKNIMYESVNKLLRIRKNRRIQNAGERSDRGTGAEIAVEKRRENCLKSVTWLLELQIFLDVRQARRWWNGENDIERETYREKLWQSDADVIQIQGLSSGARFLLDFFFFQVGQ